LADFLAPQRSRNSVPAPARDADDATTARSKASDGEGSDQHTAVTPTAPTTTSDAPPPRTEAATAAETARASLAPTSNGDARSLIPVATSDSDAPIDEEGDTFALPGTSSPWSTASVRRATFVALLAAAAAVPAWVVYRARSVVPLPDRGEASAAAAKVGPVIPSTLTPSREIEADDDKDEPAPAASAAVPVIIDPVKGAELKREARRLLENGIIDQGVATARRSIEMNPTDPECYVLLAAGLQDQGRWAESREVFSRCVHKSNTGINAECVYFATSGTLTNR
jgi:hypothetical protein